MPVNDIPWDPQVDLPGKLGGGNFNWFDTNLSGIFGRKGFTPGGLTRIQGLNPNVHFEVGPKGSSAVAGLPGTNSLTDTPAGGNIFNRPSMVNGQPELIGPDSVGGGSVGQGGFSLPGKLNPLAAALYGMLYSTPAETGELPLSMSGARPEHPQSVGRMNGPRSAPVDHSGYPDTGVTQAPFPPEKPQVATAQPVSQQTVIPTVSQQTVIPARPQMASQGSPQDAMVQSLLGHYVPTTGIGRGQATWVDPKGNLIPPGGG